MAHIDLSGLEENVECQLTPTRSEGCCLIHVKLTESCSKAIDNLITSNKGAFFSLWFSQDGGHLSIASSGGDGITKFQFSTARLNKSDTGHSKLECLHQQLDGSKSLMSSMGLVEHKLTVKATDEVYEATKKRATQLEKERQGVRAKEIKIAKVTHKVKIGSGTRPAQSNKGPLSITSKPSHNESKHLSSSSLLNRTPRTLKERVMYLLALKSIRRSDIVAKLKKATKRGENSLTNLDSVLSEVSDVHDDSVHHLKASLYAELDVDNWPFYSEAERALVKRKLLMYRQPVSTSSTATTTNHESSHSGHSGHSVPGSSGSSGHGVPGSSGSSGHSVPGSSGHGVPGSSGHGVPGSSGHGVPGSSGHSVPGSSGSSGHGVPGSSGHGVPGSSGHSVAGIKRPHDPLQDQFVSKKNRLSSIQTSATTTFGDLASISSGSTSSLHDKVSTEPVRSKGKDVEQSLDQSIISHMKTEPSFNNGSNSSLSTHNISSSITSYSVESMGGGAVKEEGMAGSSHKQKKKKKHKHGVRDDEREVHTKGESTKCHQILTESKMETDDESSFVGSYGLVDFSNQFPAITSLEQRTKYKQYFNQKYDEYLALKKTIDKAHEDLIKLSDQLEALPQNSTEIKELKAKLKEKFRHIQQDPSYQEKKSHLLNLHYKLDHLKKMVVQYDSMN